MPRIKLIVEYNGSKFHGWQKQPGVRTVQETLHEVLERVLRAKISHLMASGRTDSGVHARGQVVCFNVEELPDLKRLKHSISAILRNELSVLSLSVVRDDFDPCVEAVSKQYSYKILNRETPPVLDYGYVWHVGRRINRELLCNEAKVLVGTHDFTSLRASGCQAKSAVREILESEIIETGDYLIYRVVGRGFLKQMVRNIVGTLINIADGSLKPASILDILQLKDRRLAGITAPPFALSLDWVKYREEKL